MVVGAHHTKHPSAAPRKPQTASSAYGSSKQPHGAPFCVQPQQLKQRAKSKSFVAQNLPYTRAAHSEIGNMESAPFQLQHDASLESLFFTHRTLQTLGVAQTRRKESYV